MRYSKKVKIDGIMRKVGWDYDEENDVLYLSFGIHEVSSTIEFDDFLLVDVGLHSHRITGVELLGPVNYLTKLQTKFKKKRKE